MTANDTTIEACPNCGEADLYIRSASPATEFRRREPDKKYRCKVCTHLFNDPVERERRDSRTSGSGLVGRLERADPDEVSAE